MKNELEFATFIPKPFSYFTGDNDENQKAKGTKKYFIKLKLIFEEINAELLQSQIKIKEIKKIGFF